MNVNSITNKLLFALGQKGQLYKINSFQFYNEKQQKYSTKYQLLKRKFKREYNRETGEYELVEKYEQDFECYNKIELMKYLVKENSKGSEANG